MKKETKQKRQDCQLCDSLFCYIDPEVDIFLVKNVGALNFGMTRVS